MTTPRLVLQPSEHLQTIDEKTGDMEPTDLEVPPTDLEDHAADATTEYPDSCYKCTGMGQLCSFHNRRGTSTPKTVSEIRMKLMTENTADLEVATTDEEPT